MSSTDRLLLTLHIGFSIFTLGPLTAATMATPRYIRRGQAGVVRYLNRATRVYGLASLGIFLFGAILARGIFDQAWLSASMTLFIVALVLLVIVERDQRKAVSKLQTAAERRRAGQARAAEEAAGASTKAGVEAETPGPAPAAAPEPIPPAELAKLELGRIATISGVVALIWIVVLVLMVWNA